MSLSRRNWSALSSLARQWTMEDEEEVEREKRRRVKSSSTNADQEDDSSTNADQEDDSSPTPTPKTTSASDSAFGTDSSSETSQSSNSMEQVQLDFVEMLRVRDERRRMRHVETLRQQKEEGEDEAEVSKEGGARVELLGDMGEEKESVVRPQPPVKTSSHSPTSTSTTSSKSRTSISTKKHENEKSSGKDPDPKPSSSPARKFVSSVSISLDKSPSVSGRTTPMSPGSPSAPWSPREHCTSPCQSPSPRGAQSPVQNGHTEETGVNSSTSGNSEQANKPAFIRQSSRTVSFRMMRKKEEDPSPLQRSSSVRMASKKFESNTDQNEDENKASSFQRNSRQRISSRSIQEKMEKLAQAAQKSELTRFPDVTQRTLVLLEEVSRKRELFEKEQQVQSPASPGVSKQEIRGLTSGMSERINRWLNKSNKAGSSHSPADLRHVDISSKRSLFENSGEDSVSKASPGKI